MHLLVTPSIVKPATIAKAIPMACEFRPQRFELLAMPHARLPLCDRRRSPQSSGLHAANWTNLFTVIQAFS